MWRVDSERGSFAVKQLDALIARRPGIRDVYRASERVARSAATAGIPALPALCRDGDPVQRMGAHTVLVFDWVDGQTLGEGAAGAERCRLVGRLLARVHTLALDPSGFEATPLAPPTDEQWRALLARGARGGLAWSREVGLRELGEWCARAQRAAAGLPGPQVVSHRDLDQKNVMWRADGSPVLIDWEGVGLVEPRLELAELALCWSGALVEPADRASFLAFCLGYAEVRHPGELGAALDAALLGRLAWLAYNMERSLDGAGPEERERGAREAKREVGRLRRLVPALDGCAEWLVQASKHPGQMG